MKKEMPLQFLRNTVFFIFVLMAAGIPGMSLAVPSYMENALSHLRDADFEASADMIRKHLKKEKDDLNRLIGFAYLSFLAYIHDDFSQAEAYIGQMTAADPGISIDRLNRIHESFSSVINSGYADYLGNRLRERDSAKPSIQISEIRKEYDVGTTVRYRISGEDNILIKKITFRIPEAPNDAADRNWEVNAQKIHKTGSFSTEGWKPGTYPYMVRMEDGNGNFEEKQGSFILNSKDRTKPEGRVSGIDSKYKAGDKISFVIRASDNDMLASVRFRIPETGIDREWKIEKKKVKLPWHFSTEDLAPGVHKYLVTISDANGNRKHMSGSLEIVPAAVRDNKKPEARISGMQEEYIIGDEITYEIFASDDVMIRSMVLKVEGTDINQKFNIGAASVQRNFSFSAESLRAGTWVYSISITDSNDNTTVLKGRFTLKERKASESGGRASVLKKISTVGRDNNASFLTIGTHKKRVRIGEKIVYSFQSDKECHLILIHHSAGGEIVQLFPNRFMPETRIEAGREYKIPDKNIPIDLEVVGPAGTEKIIAIASHEKISFFEMSEHEAYFVEVNPDDPKIMKAFEKGMKTLQKKKCFQKQFSYTVLE